jgi:hypothetical protein
VRYIFLIYSQETDDRFPTMKLKASERVIKPY